MPIGIGIEQIVATAGSGAVVGGVTGYAAKKTLKLAVVLAALQVGLLVVLERAGVLDVYWGEFVAAVVEAGRGIETGVLGAVSLLAALPVAGLAGGFLLGFKTA